jgi:hypothetical protein
MACESNPKSFPSPNVSNIINELDRDDPIEYQIIVPNENLKLKKVAQEATKNRAEKIVSFCKNWKQPEEFKSQYLYFDFYHKFLYCGINKVRCKSMILILLK